MGLISSVKSFYSNLKRVTQKAKDGESAQAKKRTKIFIIVAFTFIFIFFLDFFVNQFTTLNTPNFNNFRQRDHEQVLGNWWCPDSLFSFKSLSGTSIVIRDFGSEYLNHYIIQKDIDGINRQIMNGTYKNGEPVKVGFDKDSNLQLHLEQTNLTYTFRFSRMLYFMFLHNINTGEHLVCKSIPGHVPEGRK